MPAKKKEKRSIVDLFDEHQNAIETFISHCCDTRNTWGKLSKWTHMVMYLVKFSKNYKRHSRMSRLVSDDYLHTDELAYMQFGPPVLTFPVTKWFLMQPKFMHVCSQCQVCSASQWMYMPVCKRCKRRICCKRCFDNHLRIEPNGKCSFSQNNLDLDYTISVLKSMHWVFMDLANASGENSTDTPRFNTPFYELRATNAQQTIYALRPLRLNAKIKSCFAHMTNEDFVQIMKRPYKVIVLLILYIDENQNSERYRPMIFESSLTMANFAEKMNKKQFIIKHPRGIA